MEIETIMNLEESAWTCALQYRNKTVRFKDLKIEDALTFNFKRGDGRLVLGDGYFILKILSSAK